MTFDEVEALVDELNRHDQLQADIQSERFKLFVEFAGELVGAQTRVIAKALGASVG